MLFQNAVPWDTMKSNLGEWSHNWTQWAITKRHEIGRRHAGNYREKVEGGAWVHSSYFIVYGYKIINKKEEKLPMELE